MEKLMEKLKALNYQYEIVSDNKLILFLEFRQIIIVDIQNDRLVVKNGFNGWNFLTGRIKKDLNFALKYLTFLSLFAAVLLHVLTRVFHTINHFSYSLIIAILVILTSLWFMYYYLKYLFVKKLIFDLWLNR